MPIIHCFNESNAQHGLNLSNSNWNRPFKLIVSAGINYFNIILRFHKSCHMLLQINHKWVNVKRVRLYGVCRVRCRIVTFSPFDGNVPCTFSKENDAIDRGLQSCALMCVRMCRGWRINRGGVAHCDLYAAELKIKIIIKQNFITI